MKKHLTYLFLLFAIASPRLLEGQWTTVFHRDDVQFLDIAFPTDQVGYAVGTVNDSAFIFKTVDGGNSWSSTYLNENFVSKMYFTSAGNGYILKGGNTEILHSSDSFKTWTTSSGEPCFDILGTWFPNDSTGYYLLNEGRLYTTENYGANSSAVWDSLTSYNLMAPVDAQTAYILGIPGMLKTTDGGQHWNVVHHNEVFAMEVCFTSADTGYFLQYSNTAMRIDKTEDGGITRHTVDTFPGICLAAKGNSCISVSIDGTIDLSTDGGNTWITESTGITEDAYYHAVISSNGNCFITSTKGDILKRTLPSAIPYVLPYSFSLYPNPTQKDLYVRLTHINEAMRIEVLDQLGQRLTEVPVNAQDMQIPTAHLAPGVYYLNLVNGAQREASKVFIKH